jgi:hypothetical protein
MTLHTIHYKAVFFQYGKLSANFRTMEKVDNASTEDLRWGGRGSGL